METLETATETTNNFLTSLFNNSYMNYIIIAVILFGLGIIGYVYFGSKSTETVEVFQNYENKNL